MVHSLAETTQSFDYVVLAHKAIDQDTVASQMQSAVDARTTIVIIQNGVGNEEPFRRLYADTSIITCVVRPITWSSLQVGILMAQTWVGATQTQPGIVKHTTSEDLQIGLYGNPSQDDTIEETRLSTFSSFLTSGKTRFQILDKTDIQLQRWEKVVWNAAWNSITTLTMVDTQTWLHSSPSATTTTRRLMHEVIDVGRACQVPLTHTLVDTLVDKILAMPGIGSSMQTDCRNGRPLEVDVILGVPAQKARELGIEAPVLEMVYALIQAVDLRLRAS